MYQERKYRECVESPDLVSFEAIVKETDLFISGDRDLSAEAIKSIEECRRKIEEYIRKYPEFKTSLEPCRVADGAPPIIKEMAEASSSVGVGPFAAVAGAIAEWVGNDLLKFSKEIIVENGGDIFIKSRRRRRLGIYAGSSPFTNKIALEVEAEETPLGICTSSGTVGHSLSFGKADAVIALSKSTPLADAAATGIGNIVKEETDIARGIKLAQDINGLKGLVIIKNDKIGIWGEVRLSA